ncbi:MAG: helix-turn-helix transcriptional regulator, partial [Firmicutes bacterium]|nr:helix-turn-helix transcriptional regulator [Bacillota bacterium]
MIEFKDKLKSSRIAKKLTQEELATQLNVTRQAVSKWEQGRGIPDVASLKNIARILDISIDDLLSNEETKIMVLGKSSEVKKSKRLTVISIIVCLGLCTTTILASVIINNAGALTNQTLMDYKAKILTLTPDISVESYGETYTLKITEETEFLDESGEQVTT